MRQPTPASAPRPYSARVRRGALAVGLLLALAACGDGGAKAPETTAPGTPTTATASPTVTVSPTATGTQTGTVPPVPPPTAHPTTTKPQASCVTRTIDAMSVRQRVGQLFMTAVSSTGVTTSQANAVIAGRVGSVFLMGHTQEGTAAVRAVTDRVRRLAPAVPGSHVGMFVSTDQEGGLVQVLGGPGFSTIPSAVTQGGWSTTRLRSNAALWGSQLRAAGVNMDLAPVADTVPPSLVNVNQPIGRLRRNYGTNPSSVATHSTAFVEGMRQAGVAPTIKHFPGLGRVTGNTDLSRNVVDSVTTRTDPFLQPFRSGIQAGTPFVMISNAIYARIDAAHQAVFSSAVIRSLLRDSLGFRGVVISDDLGQAVAVTDRSPARRALDFLLAGGNLVLTVVPSDIAPMTSAVLARLPGDAALRAAVDDSVRRVLVAKQNAGLLTCG